MSSIDMWTKAIADAEVMLQAVEIRVKEVERKRARLKYALRLMHAFVKDGTPWPGIADGEKGPGT